MNNYLNIYIFFLISYADIYLKEVLCVGGWVCVCRCVWGSFERQTVDSVGWQRESANKLFTFACFSNMYTSCNANLQNFQQDPSTNPSCLPRLVPTGCWRHFWIESEKHVRKPQTHDRHLMFYLPLSIPVAGRND